VTSPNAEKQAVLASITLMVASVVALFLANSALYTAYKSVLDLELGGVIGAFNLEYSIKDWIKSALMAVFFVLIGLEIKAEFLEGALKDRKSAMLPFAGAAGGMAVPAVVFLLITAGSPGLAQGWAIPSATDIAFAIGIVGLLGRAVSAPLRAFLLAVAIIDDLGAILVIALFYTGALQLWALGGMAVAIGILAFLNHRRVGSLWPYLAIGGILWLFTLQSGINATLAGVVTALFIPLKAGGGSPLHRLAHALQKPVNFIIMPVFALANAGVPLLSLGWSDMVQPLTLGIAAGLTIGKPIGICLAVWLAIWFVGARMPQGAGWGGMLGVACLAGIGFTMSLFIGALAFKDAALMDQVRLGVLAGSTLSALLAVVILKAAARRST
jgi:Na+:H+ antiporter, NhaA family